MIKNKDIIGQKFGRLIVIGDAPSRKYKSRCHEMLKVRCICGNIKIISQNDLKRGYTKSCSCLNNEKRLERNTI